MRPIKPQKDILNHPRNVIDDCTAGLPKGRERYGNGTPIVVVGVTTHHGERESRLQDKGG